MTMDEALRTRVERYAEHTDSELKADAGRDMLCLLNVFSDVEKPCMEDIRVMHMLSVAIGELGGRSMEWAAHYPEIAHAKSCLDAAFDDMMRAKAHGMDASKHLAHVFEAHGKLGALVQAMCTTEGEKSTVMAATAKK